MSKPSTALVAGIIVLLGVIGIVTNVAYATLTLGSSSITSDTTLTLGGSTDQLLLQAAISGASALVLEGATVDDFETTLFVTDPTADRTITIPNATTTLVGTDTTDTLTNKTLTSPTIGTSPTAAGATWADLGTVTTAVINGGTITGITDLALADGGTGASTAADARTNLGLGSLSTQASSAVTISGGSVAGITDLAVADGGTGAGTFTVNGLLYGNGTSALQVTSAGTSAQLLVANGSGVPTFVALSGDATLSNAGALTIASDAIEESMLKAVDTPADEEYLTYEATTGDFEWQAISSLSGALTDNTTDAFDVQESTNNYININTTNSSEDISFGNATINPSFTFLGTGGVDFNGTGGTTNVDIIAGDMLITDGSLSITDADNAESLTITNNTATTYGATPSGGGVVKLISTSLTTGTLLQLTATEATLAGGFYLTLYDNSTGGTVYTLGEDGVTTISGAGDGTAALTLTTGDLDVTDGDLDVAGGDFNVVLDAGDGVTITKGAAPTVDVFTVNSGTSATDGVDTLVLTHISDDASGAALNIIPTFTDNNADGAAEEWAAINIANFTVTQADSGGNPEATIDGIKIGNLTESASTGDTIASAGLYVGSGWDAEISLGTSTASIVIEEAGTLTVEDDTGTDFFTAAAGTITVTGVVVPEASGTRNLGSTSLEWAALYMDDDTGINLGLDQDALLAYDEATDNRVELTGTGASLWIEDRLSLGSEVSTCPDSGDGLAAACTVTPTTSYVKLDCDDSAGGCDWTLGEGSANPGDIVVLVGSTFVGPVGQMSDSSGVQEMTGGFLSIDVYDNLTFLYIDDRWIEISRSDN